MLLALSTALVWAEDPPPADEPPADEPPRTDAPAPDVTSKPVRPRRSISFEDAIELGLAYNLGLKSARFDALVARFQVAREDARWDWTLDSELGAGESLVPSRSALAGADVVDTDSANFVLGLTKPFRSGATLGLNWRNDRTFSNSTFNTINPAYDSALDITLTVPLLRGRGRSVQEAALRASRAAADAARYDFLNRAELLIQEVANAYWNLVFLQESVDVLEKALEVARDTERIELRKLEPDIGRATKLTVAQAQAERFRREADLIAGQLDAENGADTLRRLILPYTGNADDEILIVAKSALRDTASRPDLSLLVEEAMGRRQTLRRSDAVIEQLQEDLVAARNNLRIRLDFDATVTSRGVAGNLEQSAADVFRWDTPSYAGAFTLSWPIGRRDAKAAVQQAQLRLDQARVNRQETLNLVISEVRRAYRTLGSNAREIGVRRDELKASLEALEGERARLKRGVSTVLDVSRLEENAVQAALRLLQAQTLLERADVEMQRSSGTLLDRWNVKFDPNLESNREKQESRKS